ncbi:uncharacterized protein LOC123356280 [Mauremys mutica]|uniref:uncharacterized protein LOC123356280 n=1 Tax=Mauremys mutica TaxID=74926 RepID=UPI001D1693C9|nr:uncharacterized protein LOC123356280 [Mauremys mutica]XP_044855343.1 uncharacterized protein LOC123356280 [Mauremys mutica]
MEGELVIEDIEELDIEKDKHMEMTSTDSHDDGIGVPVLNLSGEGEEEASPEAGHPMVPKAPGEHLPWVQNVDSLERLMKLMCDLLDAVWTLGEQTRIVAAEQNAGSDSPASCWGSEEGVPEAKGAEPATRSPSGTSTKEALLATEDEPQASLAKTLEPGDQRSYNVIRCLIGGKSHSRGEDDTEGGYERDQQGATASPGVDKKILPETDFNQPREDGDLLLQEGWGSLWVRDEEVPPSSGRASRSFPPRGITFSWLTSCPSLDFPGAQQFNPSSETSHKTRTEPGPSGWLRPNPACQLCNDDTIHRLGGFRIFGPPDLKGLEEELRQTLSSCHKWGADTQGTVFSKAKRVFSNYCLCPSGDSRAQALARKAVLRESAVAAIQKKTLVSTMPSAHLRCSPALQATTSQHKHGDFSPLFLQWALQKLKMLVKKTAPKS